MSFLNSLNGYLDIPNANLRVNGSGQFSSINVGSTRILAGYDLDTVTSVGSITPYTIEFSNATTGIVTTSNGQIGGDLTVLGNAAVSSNLTVAGNATVSSNLTVAGNATVSSNLNVAGNTTVAGNATVSSNLTVAGNATVSSNLTVAGNTMMSSNLELSSNLILNEDLFLVGNTQIHINSNVVTEFTGPHGRPQATLTKFPEIQMTEAAQAGYVVSASAEDSANDRYAWKAFNNILPANSSTDFWFSGSSRGAYTGGSSGREYVGSSNLGTDSGRTATVDGEWIQVHLPYKIQLTTFNIFGQPNTINNFPASGVLYARNETTEDWTSIYVYNDVVISTNNTKATHTLTTSTFYNTYALSITKKSDSVGGVSVGELKLFGTPEVETAGNISQDTTLKSIYNTPSNLDANVYLDGDLGATLTNQISGGPTLTGTGATYDSVGKYWSLDGSTESNVVTGDLAFQGDQPHSVSLWFNSSNLEANVANSTIYHIGTEAATGDATHKVRIVNKSLSWNYENDIPLKANTWHHLTHTYGGVGGYRTLYLDGRKVESAYAWDTAGLYPPFPMSGYSQGGYTVTSSSENFKLDPGYKLFNHNTGDYWHTDYPLYSTTSPYTYTGGNTLSTYNGEWVTIDLNQNIKLYNVSLYNRNGYTNNAPSQFVILGSSDNLNWNLLSSVTSTSWTNSLPNNIIMNSEQYYRYYGFVFTHGNGSTNIALGEIKLYGHKENDLIRFPDATNVRKYPDTAMAGPAQRGYTVSTSSEYSDGSGNDYLARKAFDGTIANDVGAWISDNSPVTYSTSSPFDATAENSLSGITGGVGSRNGAWLKLELPHKIKLNEARLYGRYNANTERIDAGYIYGSNDDTNWTQIGEISVSGISSGNLGTYTEIDPLIITSTDTTNYYKYFIIQPTSLTHANGYAGIGQMEYYGTQESTPVLARLGGAFEGKVANFRVYNKCIKEDQALELWDAQKDQFGLAKSSVTVYKGRVGIGTTEPQAALTVADEVAIPKSGEFPPGPMTNYETRFKDHGLFRASSTGEVNTSFLTWKAFGDTWYGDSPFYSWEGNISYSTSTGYLTTPATAPITNGIAGAWVQLELPYTILLTSWSFTPERRATIDNVGRDRAPQDGYLFGSTDGSTWSVVENWTGRVSWADGHTSIFNVTTSTYYKYFRLVWTRTRPGGTYSNNPAAGNLSFFGTPETTTKYSTLHDGELTLTKSLNVPRIGPALDADAPAKGRTPRRDRLVVEYNTSTNPTFEGGVRDTSGRGLHGVFRGPASYDATEKAFDIAGTPNGRSVPTTSAYLEVGQRLPFTGNQAHTTSLWFKKNNVGTDYALFSMWKEGTNYITNGNHSGVMVFSTGKLQFWHYGGDIVYTDPLEDTSYGGWRHLVAVYTGQTVADQKLYINGIEAVVSSSSVITTTIDITNATMTVGQDHYRGDYYNQANTEFSGIKVYDTALTAEEVKTLYDMGRCDEGHHVVNFSKTRVGIGLGDGEAPRSALDVRDLIYAESSTVQTFTGQHRCVPEGPMEPGLIVSADKNRYVNLNGGLKTGSKAITIDESLPVVALSNVSQDKSCFGVVSSVEGVGTSRSETKGGFISETPKVLGDNRAIVNSLGEGALWVVNTGGPLESGDYVTTANVAGYGQRQDDDVLHNYTVAKITMDCDFTASNVATQAPKKVETLVTVEEGVWSNLSAYNRSSETQTQYINGENVVLTEGEWSNLATEEQNTYSDTTITTYYEIRRGENLLDENGNIQWEDTDGVEPGYKVRFLTSDGTQTDEANAVHTAAFVGCTYHCG
jgi:hypothetical protein